MWSWLVFLLLSHRDGNTVAGTFLSNGHGAEDERFAVNGALCAEMSVVGFHSIYRVSDGHREVRSVVNEGGTLVDCSVIVDDARVKYFMRVCRLGLQDPQPRRSNGNQRFMRMKEAETACRAFTWRSDLHVEQRSDLHVEQRSDVHVELRSDHMELRSDHTELRSDHTELELLDRDAERPRRSKRGFTYPGTLWCGAGNMADHDDHLGQFAETDVCCRTHDHCPHVIHPFSSKYGYTNFKWHSICHCDCDTALRRCLRKVNDTASRVVGQAFFNVIGAPCFQFVYEDRCVERHWYGLCKRYERQPVAVPQQPVPYDFGGVDVISAATVAPRKKAAAAATEAGEREKPPEPSPAGDPGESSLGTVVAAAAEDLVKVLATVSTSQGSSSSSPAEEAAEGDASESEKKKRKKKKKKRKKTRGSGKRRGRKGKVERGASDGKGNFMTPTGESDRSARDPNGFVDGDSRPPRREGTSNEVMKDEPMRDEETTAAEATWSPSAAAGKGRATASADASPSVTVTTPRRTNARAWRRGQKRGEQTTKTDARRPTVALNATRTEGTSGSGTTLADADAPTAVTTTAVTTTAVTTTAVTTTARLAPPRPKGRFEPVVTPHAKRNGSGGRTARRRKKKRRKTAPPAAFVSASREHSAGGLCCATGVYGGPTASSTPPTMSPEPWQPRQRGPSAPPLFDENPLLQKSSERGAATRTTTTSTLVPRSPEERRHDRRRPSGSAQKTRREGKRRRSHESSPGVRSDGAAGPANGESAREPGTFARFNVTAELAKSGQTGALNLQESDDTFYVTTTRNPLISPIQLSIRRAKEQFDFKKRRKAARSFRQK